MARPERLRLGVATGLGLGYAPVAPGTVGSLGGVLLAWALGQAFGWPAVALATVALTLVGFWAAGIGPSHFGAEDPGPIVIDEIAGQMLALLLLPPTPLTLVGGFLLFRLFDIWKPFPVNRLEKLPGASGIMADDLMAGVLANVTLRVVYGVL